MESDDRWSSLMIAEFCSIKSDGRWSSFYVWILLNFLFFIGGRGYWHPMLVGITSHHWMLTLITVQQLYRCQSVAVVSYQWLWILASFSSSDRENAIYILYQRKGIKATVRATILLLHIRKSWGSVCPACVCLLMTSFPLRHAL